MNFPDDCVKNSKWLSPEHDSICRSASVKAGDSLSSNLLSTVSSRTWVFDPSEEEETATVCSSEEDAQDVILNCAVLSIFYASNNCSGFAALINSCIKVMDGELNLIECIFREISPRQVVISDSFASDGLTSIRAHTLPIHCFSLKKAQRLVEHLNLTFHLSSAVLKAIGGLAHFVGGKLQCSHVEQLTLSSILHIDNPGSLQVFETKSDTVSKGKFNCEFNSLYSLLNHCASKSGSLTLFKWLRYPSANLSQISLRLQAIQALIEQSNNMLFTSLRKTLSCIHPMNQLFHRMRDGRTSLPDMRLLRRTLNSLMHLIELSDHLPSDVYICNYFRGHHNLNSLKSAVEMINNIIDFENDTEKLSISTGFDAYLDRLKSVYSSFPNILTVAAEEEVSDGSSTRCRVAFVPQIGFVIEIPDGICSSNLELMFASESFKYYKSDRMHRLDELLGDIHNQIADREWAIIHNLQEKLLTLTPIILELVEHAGTLDVIISLALVSRNMGFSRPIVGSPFFSIHEGWNPLQERSTTVCNDFLCNSGIPFIITGESTSGKSVFLTQVGLVTILAHIGCFVPAKKASIPLLKHIFSNMKPTEIRGSSSYCIDIKKISFALKKASEESLVLIDDFGKGTIKSDAQAILISSLKYWLKRRNAPFLVIATNFPLDDSLFAEPITHMIMENVNGINTYKLRPYNCNMFENKSIEICRRSMLPAEVVDRAEQLLLALSKQFIPMECLVHDDSEIFREWAHRIYNILSENQT